MEHSDSTLRSGKTKETEMSVESILLVTLIVVFILAGPVAAWLGNHLADAKLERERRR